MQKNVCIFTKLHFYDIIIFKFIIFHAYSAWNYQKSGGIKWSTGIFMTSINKKQDEQ